MNAFVGIDHVQVVVPAGTERACHDFYVGALGMTEIERPAATAGRSFLWVRIGAQQVHFRVDADFHAARLAHPAFLVSDVDALEKTLAAGGFDVTRGEAVAAGRVHVRDPFGNRLEFIQSES